MQYDESESVGHNTYRATDADADHGSSITPDRTAASNALVNISETAGVISGPIPGAKQRRCDSGRRAWRRAPHESHLIPGIWRRRWDRMARASRTSRIHGHPCGGLQGSTPTPGGSDFMAKHFEELSRVWTASPKDILIQHGPVAIDRTGCLPRYRLRPAGSGIDPDIFLGFHHAVADRKAHQSGDSMEVELIVDVRSMTIHCSKSYS